MHRHWSVCEAQETIKVTLATTGFASYLIPRARLGCNPVMTGVYGRADEWMVYGMTLWSDKRREALIVCHSTLQPLPFSAWKDLSSDARS